MKKSVNFNKIDCFFAIQVWMYLEWNKLDNNEKLPYFIMFICCLIFLIIPMLLSIIEL